MTENPRGPQLLITSISPPFTAKATKSATRNMHNKPPTTATTRTIYTPAVSTMGGLYGHKLY